MQLFPDASNISGGSDWVFAYHAAHGSMTQRYDTDPSTWGNITGLTAGRDERSGAAGPPGFVMFRGGAPGRAITADATRDAGAAGVPCRGQPSRAGRRRPGRRR